MPVPSASVQVEDWNQPASGHGGPIGPFVTVELVQAFVSLPKPCIIRLTSPPNSELAKTISWILAHGAPTGGEICRVDDAPPGPPNVDVTSSAVEPTKEPGIVVHWDEDFNPWENYIAHLLDSDGFESQHQSSTASECGAGNDSSWTSAPVRRGNEDDAASRSVGVLNCDEALSVALAGLRTRLPSAGRGVLRASRCFRLSVSRVWRAPHRTVARGFAHRSLRVSVRAEPRFE